jgi:glutathione synthase/RimK-type ligase-like ATP-grasp enzyme
VFNQRHVADYELALEIVDGAVGGLLRLGRRSVPVSDLRASYVRLMDDRHLPESSGRCRTVHEALDYWLEVTPARVVNRTAAQASNGSKPYQAQLIVAAGLRTPETLITNDPDAVVDFRDRHRRVIFKSMSGVRSIVRELDDDALSRLERLRWCPAQFQELVPGRDVRVHCVHGEVHATEVRSTATDYRYGASSDQGARLKAITLDDGLSERCLRLTAALDLELAGIDLRLPPEGDPYCFEVNPSPAFSYYQDHTGQPIAQAIARHLAAA